MTCRVVCAVTVPTFFDPYPCSLPVRLGARVGALVRWANDCPYAQILATLSIITNSLLVGVTSYGLYFYFPEMSIVESLW